MFDIVIKDNMDISSIVDIFKNSFKKIITNNFEIIERISPTNRVMNIQIISNCYSNILSNFSYTIELIQSNFGLNGRKVFNEVIEMMKNEMDNLIKMLILAHLHEKNIEFDNSWVVFLTEESKMKTISNIYFRNSKLNWKNMVSNLYQNYFLNFKDIKSRELTDEYKELLWDQVTNIEDDYQKMFDILNTKQNINKLIIDSDKIIFIPEGANNKINNIDNDNKDKKMFLLLNNEKTENDKKHKISKFSYCYIKYMYEYLVVYTYLPDELKDGAINQIMKLTRDILSFSKEIIINNDSGMINNTKQITEKETSLYYSDLIIIQKCLQNFLDTKNFGKVILTDLKETIDLLNSLKNTCYDMIMTLTQQVNSSFISEFNTMNFTNYKTFSSAKEYNSYTKKLTTLKKLYDNVGNAFLTEDINKIFTNTFNTMFNQFKKAVEDKGIIEDDSQLKQFRGELTYIKKVFKLFNIVDCSKYKEIIDDINIKVNPNKLPRKKKKAKANKEEDNKDDNED